MSTSTSDSPGEGAARSLVDRVARSIAGVKDWSGGFSRSPNDLRRELREVEVEGVGAITVTNHGEVAMGSTGEVRVAAVELGAHHRREVPRRRRSRRSTQHAAGLKGQSRGVSRRASRRCDWEYRDEGVSDGSNSLTGLRAARD